MVLGCCFLDGGLLMRLGLVVLWICLCVVGLRVRRVCCLCGVCVFCFVVACCIIAWFSGLVCCIVGLLWLLVL